MFFSITIYRCARTLRLVALCIDFRYAWYKIQKYKIGDKKSSSFAAVGGAAYLTTFIAGAAAASLTTFAAGVAAAPAWPLLLLVLLLPA